MDYIEQDTLLFFKEHPAALPVYEAFARKLAGALPNSNVRVQKTQITFSNRHVYACVSFLRVKKKAELPDSFFVLTFGLPYALESERVAVKIEPYPGRWTTHFVISRLSDLDEELFAWVRQAYAFAAQK
ncbi:DUF5655 domain-containing protein [bacterium]|nr:DUF5655 domain-containing protein [bacterium]